MSRHLDRAGKQYWDGVWAHVDSPRAIDPSAGSIWAHRDQLFHRFFKKYLAMAHPRGSVIELGCARSAWLPYFATEFGYGAAGLDYSESGARQTAERMEESGIPADIRCVDLFDPPADWLGKFDLVVWFGVVEHFENTARAIQAAAAYLKPGGVMVTEAPNMVGLVGLVQRWFNRPVYELHVPVSRTRLADAHTGAGLEVVTAQYLVPIDFGIVNLENVPKGIVRYVKDRILYMLRLLTGCLWWLDRRVGPMTPGRLTGGFIMVVARKPAAPLSDRDVPLPV